MQSDERISQEIFEIAKNNITMKLSDKLEKREGRNLEYWMPLVGPLVALRDFRANVRNTPTADPPEIWSDSKQLISGLGKYTWMLYQTTCYSMALLNIINYKLS